MKKEEPYSTYGFLFLTLKLLFKMLFANYYIRMMLDIMPVSLIFCQKFLCAVPTSESPRLIFRHLSGNIDRT